MKRMPDDQKFDLVDKLELRKVPFKKFWALSDIFFTSDIQTACVTFNKDQIQMLFNPQFWEELGLSGQLFIICHEQMHLILNHYARLNFKEGNANLKNIAADLSVNHMLVRNYLFEKTDLPQFEKYCWVETVFPDQTISDNETAQFYYTILLKNLEVSSEDFSCECSGGTPLDDHSITGEIPKPILDKLKEIVDEHVADTTEDMSEDEKTQWLEEFYEETGINYDTTGFGHGNQTHNIKPKPSQNWKQLYKLIPKNIYTTKVNSHWINRQRNHILLPEDLLLPCEVETDKEDMVVVNVYLDSSGSCINHAKYFLESALTLPKKMFSVNLFGFGTKVYELTKTPPYNLKGFGNESYQAVSDHVDNFSKRVDAILVFTDGYSRPVSPTHPKKWHWFITPNGTTKTVPKNSKFYNLEHLRWKGKYN